MPPFVGGRSTNAGKRECASWRRSPKCRCQYRTRQVERTTCRVFFIVRASSKYPRVSIRRRGAKSTIRNEEISDLEPDIELMNRGGRLAVSTSADTIYEMSTRWISNFPSFLEQTDWVEVRCKVYYGCVLPFRSSGYHALYRCNSYSSSRTRDHRSVENRTCGCVAADVLFIRLSQKGSRSEKHVGFDIFSLSWKKMNIISGRELWNAGV
jgi:hypothetical protein